MSRGYSTESIAALADNPELYQLISLGFSTELNYTTAPHDIEYDGKTWLSSAVISQIPVFKETLAERPNTFNLKIDGVALANQALTLSENFNGVSVKIYRYVYATSQALLEFEGLIRNYSTSENHESGKAIIAWVCSSHITTADRLNGRILTHEAQMDTTGDTDTGLEYIDLVDDNIENWAAKPKGRGFWGRLSDSVTGLFDATGINSVVDAFGDFVSGFVDSFSGSGSPQDIALEQAYNLIGTPKQQKRLPVCYGSCRVAGIPVFRDVATGDTSELYVVYVLGEGENGGLSGAKIKFVNADGGETAYDASTYSSHVTLVDEFLGTDSGGHSTSLQTANAKWDTTRLLKNMHQVVLKFDYSDVLWSGLPEPIFYLDGKKIYDMRDGTTAVSSNPALINYDYRTSTLYGFGVSTGKFILSSYIAAANYCEAQVTNHDATGSGFYSETAASINMREFNGAMMTDIKIKANLAKIDHNMMGFTAFIAGKYSIVNKQESETAVFAFNEDNISRKHDFKVTELDPSKKFNSLYYQVNDSRNGYKGHAMPAISSTYLSDDNGIQNTATFVNNYETDKYRGLNFAATLLRESRSSIRVNLTCTDRSALEYVSAGVIVSITRESKGWTTANLFRVISVTITATGLLSCDVAQYTSDDYLWDINVEAVRPDDTNLPDPFTVLAPTGITAVSSGKQLTQDDGAATNRIYISWGGGGDPYVTGYEAQYRNDSDAWVRLPNLTAIDDTDFYIPNADEGQVYDARVRAFNSQGTTSDWNTLSVESSTHTVTGTQAVGRLAQIRGADAYENDSIYYHTLFDSIDQYATFGTPSLNTLEGLYVSYGDSVIKNLSSTIAVPTWDKNRRFKASVAISTSSWGDADGYIITGATTGGGDYVGFKIQYDGVSSADIYAVAENSGETATLITSVSVSDSAFHTYEVVFTTGVSAVMTIDGANATTVTTNLPSGTGGAGSLLHFSVLGTTGTGGQMKITEARVLQEQ